MEPVRLVNRYCNGLGGSGLFSLCLINILVFAGYGYFRLLYLGILCLE